MGTIFRRASENARRYIVNEFEGVLGMPTIVEFTNPVGTVWSHLGYGGAGV